MGGAFGGWTVYLQGRPAHCYNLFGLQRFKVYGDPTRSPAGEHQVRVEFTYDGGGLGKGGAFAALRRRQPRSDRLGARHGADGLLRGK